MGNLSWTSVNCHCDEFIAERNQRWNFSRLDELFLLHRILRISLPREKYDFVWQFAQYYYLIDNGRKMSHPSLLIHSLNHHTELFCSVGIKKVKVRHAIAIQINGRIPI